MSTHADTGRAAVNLTMDDSEAHDVHHALSTAVTLIDFAAQEPGGIPPDAPLAGEARSRLVTVARRLDHERRHHGAVRNPNVSARRRILATIATECPGQDVAGVTVIDDALRVDFVSGAALLVGADGTLSWEGPR